MTGTAAGDRRRHHNFLDMVEVTRHAARGPPFLQIASIARKSRGTLKITCSRSRYLHFDMFNVGTQLNLANAERSTLIEWE